MIDSFSFTTDAWAEVPAITLEARRMDHGYRYHLSLDGYRSVECEGIAPKSLIERMEKIARAWKPSYFRPVLDDNNWTIEWTEGKRVENRQGNNAFPEDWNQFLALVFQLEK